LAHDAAQTSRSRRDESYRAIRRRAGSKSSEAQIFLTSSRTDSNDTRPAFWMLLQISGWRAQRASKDSSMPRESPASENFLNRPHAVVHALIAS
jgi:hypothetical protein